MFLWVILYNVNLSNPNLLAYKFVQTLKLCDKQNDVIFLASYKVLVSC